MIEIFSHASDSNYGGGKNAVRSQKWHSNQLPLMIIIAMIKSFHGMIPITITIRFKETDFHALCG